MWAKEDFLADVAVGAVSSTAFRCSAAVVFTLIPFCPQTLHRSRAQTHTQILWCIVILSQTILHWCTQIHNQNVKLNHLEITMLIAYLIAKDLVTKNMMHHDSLNHPTPNTHVNTQTYICHLCLINIQPIHMIYYCNAYSDNTDLNCQSQVGCWKNVLVLKGPQVRCHTPLTSIKYRDT